MKVEYFINPKHEYLLRVIRFQSLVSVVYHYAKQKHLGCKKSARPIRSHYGYISD